MVLGSIATNHKSPVTNYCSGSLRISRGKSPLECTIGICYWTMEDIMR